MRCKTCLRIIPNIFVIGIGTGLFSLAVIIVFPDCFRNSNHNFLFGANFVVVLFFYLMWLWSWGTAIICDPGRTIDDLRSRGCLKRVQNGDIPNCIRHLPICSKCKMPKPAGAAHCDFCDACHLRCDHHCAITGQCVADKTLKAFILSFFYSAFFALSFTPPSLYSYFVIRRLFIVPLLLMIYGPVFFVMMTVFGFSFLIQAMEMVSAFERMKTRSKTIGLAKFLRSFGDTFLERITPIQEHTTKYAWPGVNWEDEDNILL